MIWVFPKIGVFPPKWMVYDGKPYQNGWFGGTPIFGNIHISNMKCGSKVKSSKTYLFPRLQNRCVKKSQKKALAICVAPFVAPICDWKKKVSHPVAALSNNRNVERSRTLQSPALKRCEIRTDDLKRSKYYVFAPGLFFQSYKTRPSKLEMWNLSPIFSSLSFDLSSIFSWKIGQVQLISPCQRGTRGDATKLKPRGSTLTSRCLDCQRSSGEDAKKVFFSEFQWWVDGVDGLTMKKMYL